VRGLLRRRDADEIFRCATSIKCAGEFSEGRREPIPSVDVQAEFVVAGQTFWTKACPETNSQGSLIIGLD